MKSLKDVDDNISGHLRTPKLQQSRQLLLFNLNWHFQVEDQVEEPKAMNRAVDAINSDMTRRHSMTLFKADNVMTILANSQNASLEMARDLIDDASEASTASSDVSTLLHEAPSDELHGRVDE